MVLSGCPPPASTSGGGGVQTEEQLLLASQSGSMRLDKFVHCLIVKCSLEMLDTLLTTLIYEIKNDSAGGKLWFVCEVVRKFRESHRSPHDFGLSPILFSAHNRQNHPNF